MKYLITFLLLIIATFTSTAQDITGQWNGVLRVPGVQIRVIFNVNQTETGYSSTMDSPDQGAVGIPVTNTTFEDLKIKFEQTAAKIVYTGELKGDEIVGTFSQAGQVFPMNLSREAIEKEVVVRPQEPAEPYPYYSEDVEFKNTQADLSLAGTLTLPKKEGAFPAVILISGSGPQNRDEELLNHKPFLVISDYLTKNGIAVLRYDDRGVAQSTGEFKGATSADFATDVESAVAYLKTRKEIKHNEIGLMGHSEGGIIAPMVAAKSKDVSFIILLAGTGIPGDELLLIQSKLISIDSGIPEEEIEKTIQMNTELFKMATSSNDNRKLALDLTDKINEMLENEVIPDLPSGLTKEKYISMQVSVIADPWMVHLLKFDPATALEQVDCPVLALNGENDLQVPSKENLSAIKSALMKGGNKNVTTKEYPNLNHLFQESETGSPNEYGTIEQTFSPTVLADIVEWIKVQTD